MIKYLVATSLTTFSVPAFAYLDPGTGSMLLSAIVGLIATVLFSIKSSYYKLVGYFYKLTGRKLKRNRSRLVFYSEGKQYWNTFKPVLEALEAKEVNAVYLTSDSQDPGLDLNSDFIEAQYIGEGNRAYTYLNLLEADVCAMTTPGLDVLQIVRSKGVKHYAHLVHAPTDMGLYKLYSFDYYDSIFVSGEHQKRSIRELEKLRNTAEKLLVEAGCPYMDVLAERLEKARFKSNESSAKTNTILVAPTWGQNGLLTRFSSSLIKSLLATGMNIIIRPHPQSFISENELMLDLQKEFINESKLVWDKSPDGFNSLLNSDLLISDLSGVVFDYAFVFEKPVITLDFEYNWKGMEANDLPYKLWELEILDKLGKTIGEEDIVNLPQIITKVLQQENLNKSLQDLRKASLYNYRNSGNIIADNLIDLLKEEK